jgi:hypothetical protein
VTQRLRGNTCPPDVVAYLRQSVPQATGASDPVVSVEALAAGVWRVQRQAGKILVAKHQLFGPLGQNAPHDLLKVEQLVLAHLGSSGCPVPAVLGADPQQHVIFLEWAGDLTLDDWAHENPAASMAPMVRQLIHGCQRIDAAMARLALTLGHRAAPGCDRIALNRAWETAATHATTALRWLLGAFPEACQRAATALQRVCTACGARPACLGTADYNARNVVISDAGKPLFIEFATLSWDWPERRLVQYATPLGAGRPEGRFIGLLDRDAADEWARQGGNGGALDQHHLVFMLNAVQRLLHAAALPGSDPAGALALSGALPASRLAQLRQLIGQSLSSDPSAEVVRQCVRRAAPPITRTCDDAAPLGEATSSTGDIP